MFSKIHSKVLIASMLWLSGEAIFGQNAKSLEDCVNYAQSNNPQIRLAQLAIADAEWRVKENLATGLPQVSAGVTYTGFIQRGGLPTSALGFGAPGDDSKIYFNAVHGLAGKLELSQLIFNNSYLIGLRAAKFYKEYTKIGLDVTRQTLRNQVTDAYLPALLISDNLNIFDKNIANLEKMLGETKAVNKAGFAEQLDVDRLELTISSLKNERENIARQREMVVNALKMVMGMPISEQISLSDDSQKLASQFADADLTTPVNFMNRPEYVQLLKGRELSALQVELYQKPWMPTVAGFASYQPGFQGGFGQKGDDGFNKWYFIPSAVAGVSVSVPIYNGGGSKAHKERAIISVQTLEAQKVMLENAISLEAENARKQFLNASDRVKNQQKNLDLARKIQETTQTKFKAGVGSSFELVNAEAELLKAQQALTQAQFDLLSARVAVKKALGNQ